MKAGSGALQCGASTECRSYIPTRLVAATHYVNVFAGMSAVRGQSRGSITSCEVGHCPVLVSIHPNHEGEGSCQR